MLKNFEVIILMMFIAFAGCAKITKPVNPWVGLWKISQKSFEDAQTGPMCV